MCGEKTLDYPPLFKGWGSPPRVRGKVLDVQVQYNAGRITPACAGKRYLSASRCSSAQDHPRVCGEKIQPFIKLHECLGSPPRVRGKASCPHQNHFGIGITPACAGKSFSAAARLHLHPDHPRVCGEKRFPAFFLSKIGGSPPRVRGKV